MDEKLKNYILFILNGILGKEYISFGHDWGRQFDHDDVYVALTLLIKYSKCGEGYFKKQIIEWFEKSDFTKTKFLHGGGSDDMYLLINLHNAIHRSIAYTKIKSV